MAGDRRPRHPRAAGAHAGTSGWRPTRAAAVADRFHCAAGQETYPVEMPRSVTAADFGYSWAWAYTSGGAAHETEDATRQGPDYYLPTPPGWYHPFPRETARASMIEWTTCRSIEHGLLI